MTVKSDNEPAMSALVTKIGKLRAANGAGQGQVRVLRSAVEEKWGVKFETAHSISPWLVEYAFF